jgi:hypothetical protein
VKRRTLRSHRTPFFVARRRSRRGGSSRSGTESAGTGLEAEWLAEVGRTHRDIRLRGRVPSPREVVVGVERARRHERGRIGVRVPRGIFYRTLQRIRFVRESVRAPPRRKAFWIVRTYAPHRACRRRSWLVGENRTTGNGAGGELTSRTGAAKRCLRVTRNVRGGCRFGQGSSSLVRRGGSDIGTRRATCKRPARNRESVDAPRDLHRSWRQRIAAPRLEAGSSQRELCWVPSAPLPYLDARVVAWYSGRPRGPQPPCRA